MKYTRCGIVCAVCGALLCMLCGCANLSLGQRAIVKAIYLDGMAGEYTASLVVFTCEPTTDTASAKGEAKIYSATEQTIGEALEAAERQQAKQPFYAQNELLFLGPAIARSDIGTALSYFTGEQAARPNLSVFVVPMTAEQFSQQEKNMSQTVEEAERIADDAQAGVGRTMSELALQNEENVFSGLIPLLQFGDDKPPKVTSMVLYQNGELQGAMGGTQLQLALVGGSQIRRLQFSFYEQGSYYHVETQRLRLVKLVNTDAEVPQLSLYLDGSTAVLTKDGKPLHGKDARQAVSLANAFLVQEWEKMMNRTYLKGNDVCNFFFWIKQEDISAATELMQQPALWKSTVSFQSELRAA